MDIGSDENLMPFNIFTKLFPSTTADQLVARKDPTKLRTYNCTTSTQLARCIVEIENNNKHKKYIFFVVAGDKEVLLGIPDIELLNILNRNCNTISTNKDEKGANCNASEDSIPSAASEKCSANTGPERSCTKTNSNTGCYTNRRSNNSNNKQYNAFLPMVNNNEVKCSPSAPSRETNTTI